MQLRTFGLAALTGCLPWDQVAARLLEHGRVAKRNRKLTTSLVLGLVVGMAYHRDLSMSDVLAKLCEDSEIFGWSGEELPHSTSITQARDRLGWEVVRAISRDLAANLDRQYGASETWLSLSVYALDGSTLRAQDTAANDKWFGRPKSTGATPSAYPMFRAAVVFNVFTHIASQVAFGPYEMNELKVAAHLLDGLRPGSLLLLDRAYHNFVWPLRLTQRGVFYVLRAKTGERVIKLKRIRRLGPGDWLCEFAPSPHTQRRYKVSEPVLVREITAKRGRVKLRLLTSLLDESAYPADAIVDLYRERWEAEQAYRELKVYMNEETVTFRSHTPDRVLQEAYGLVLAYNCLRGLMAQAAREREVSPLRLSFTKCLERLRWQADLVCLGESTTAERLAERLVAKFKQCVLQARRKGRSCERTVKGKPARYARKRPGKPPRPTRRESNALRRSRRSASARSSQAAPTLALTG